LNKIFKKKKQVEAPDPAVADKTPSFLFRTRVQKTAVSVLKSKNLALH